MRSANETLFREIVPTLTHIRGQYNRGDGREYFQGSTFYDIYPRDSSFRVYDHNSGNDCGNFSMDDLVFWAFTSYWKWDGLFVEEWLEQLSGPDIDAGSVEALL